MAKVSQVRARIPADLAARDSRCIHQAADRRLGQFIALGVSTHFCRRGLQTNIRELRKQGLHPLAVGAIGEFAIAGITLALIFTASRVLGTV